MEAVGEYLQVRRKLAGFTQEDVADLVGVKARTVSDWEAGRYMPNFLYMAQVIAMIQADPRIVQELMMDGSATVESARIYAQQPYSIRPPKEPILDPEVDAVIKVVQYSPDFQKELATLISEPDDLRVKEMLDSFGRLIRQFRPRRGRELHES